MPMGTNGRHRWGCGTSMYQSGDAVGRCFDGAVVVLRCMV